MFLHLFFCVSEEDEEEEEGEGEGDEEEGVSASLNLVKHLWLSISFNLLNTN